MLGSPVNFALRRFGERRESLGGGALLEPEPRRIHGDLGKMIVGHAWELGKLTLTPSQTRNPKPFQKKTETQTLNPEP